MTKKMRNRYIGIVLIIAGVILAYWGYDLYNSTGSKLSRAFNGDAPIEAWGAMIGGVLCAAFGIYKVV